MNVHASTWMNLENILSDGSLKQKATYFMVYMNVQNRQFVD